MQVTLVRSLKALAPYQADWAAAAMRDPFTSFEAVTHQLATARTGVSPALLVAHEQGVVVAVAPWCQEPGLAGLRVWTGVGGEDAWFHDPVILQPGRELAVATALAGFLAAERGAWDSLRLCLRPQRSQALIQALSAVGLSHAEAVSWRQHQAMDLSGGWATYWEARPTGFRRTLGRYAKRLQGVSHQLIQPQGEDADRALETLFRLQAANKHGIRDWEAYQAGMRALCKAARSRGQLVVAMLEIEGQPAAIDVVIRAGHAAFGLLRGFDPAYSRYCAGLQLTSWLLEQLAASGVQYVDGGPGHYEWKRQFQNATTETTLVQVASPACLRAMVGVGYCRYLGPWVEAQRTRLRGLKVPLAALRGSSSSASQDEAA